MQLAPFPRPADEPVRATLYAPVWNAARTRADRLARAPHRRLFRTLLDTVERGWRIIAPVYKAVEGAPPPRDPVAADVYAFVEIDVGDLFRTLCFECAEMVPTESGWSPDLSYVDLDTEMGVAVRNLRVLDLACADPRFPDALRGVVTRAAPALLTWQDTLPAVLEPVVDMIERVQFRGAAAPRFQP